jgi:hypothetical protein
MAINILGAIAVVSVYWAIWYTAMSFRRRLRPNKEVALKWLWRFNAGALLGSGACFVGAALLNPRIGEVKAPDQAQAIAALVIVLVLGTLGFVSFKRTAKAKAAEVQAASIPAGKLHGWTVESANGPTPIEAFSERFMTPHADSIINEIKGMRP